MPLFKKENKKFPQIKIKEEPVQKFDENNTKPSDTSQEIIKKRTRIGFRHKKEKLPINEIISKEKIEEIIEEPIEKEEKPPLPEKKEEKEYTTEKKTIIKKDMKNKPVFLEDTGERLGVVFDTIYDKDNNAIGYKIKDEKSDAILSFPSDQFDYNRDGLIFVPGWYTNALKLIEKLEFKDKISPELTALLSDDAVSNEELYDIFVKHDDEMAKYIDETISLKEVLNNRLKILEKQRIALKDNLIDLTEKRLIKDIDRTQFSEDVMKHRRKANILDLNINKCKNLLKRIDNTSFGVLGKSRIIGDTYATKTEKSQRKKVYEKIAEKDTLSYDNHIETGDSYKEKYFTLREQFEQLEEDYQELKVAIDKLLSKGEV